MNVSMVTYFSSLLIALNCSAANAQTRGQTNDGSWTKLVDCEKSETVIDQKTAPDGNTDYQIVFRNPKTVADLLQTGAVDTRRLTSLSEIVLNLTPMKNENAFWVGEDDTRQLLGLVYYVRVRGDSIGFEAHRTTGQTTGEYRVIESVGNWTFGQCVEPASSATAPFLADRKY